MNEELLRAIWEEQPGGFYRVGAKHRDRWKDRVFDDIDDALVWLDYQPEGSDLYWCPTPFTKARALKENVAGSRFLWSDLDEADPRGFPKDLQPTIAWESSPGRFHGLWRLDRVITGQELEDLNRDMTYEFVPLGADKGGWDLTQVLRIPGTRNYKYPEAPTVKLLWRRSKAYPVGTLRERLSKRPTEPLSASQGTFDDALKRNLSKLDARARSTLLATRAEEGKRSDIVWWLSHRLAELGVPAPDIETLIKGSVWNKYRGRRDEDRRIKHDVARAIEAKVVEPPSEEPRSQAPQPTSFSVTLESDFDLMSSLDSVPGWMIKDFWTRRSHGIVAGEPKSYKSFLTHDAAISVASGKPFLGEYEVSDVGPVLVVQNENARWIMRNRAEKIRAAKGLVGSVSHNGPKLKVRFAPDLPLYYINQASINLMNPVHQELLVKAVEQIEPVLVILDPLYLMFDGDVNSQKDLNPFLLWLMEVKTEYDFSLMLLHHMHKAKDKGEKRRGGQRLLGSTTLHGWTESAWYIDVLENDPDGRSIVSLEREFRATNSPGNLKLGISSGAWDAPTYRVEIDPQGGDTPPATSKDSEIARLLEGAGEFLSATMIAKSTGLSRRQVTRDLDDLLRQGLVTKKGNRFAWA